MLCHTLSEDIFTVLAMIYCNGADAYPATANNSLHVACMSEYAGSAKLNGQEPELEYCGCSRSLHFELYTTVQCLHVPPTSSDTANHAILVVV